MRHFKNKEETISYVELDEKEKYVIRALLVASNVSAIAITKHIGLSRCSYFNKMSGKTSWRKREIDALLSFFDLTEEDFKRFSNDSFINYISEHFLV